MIANKGFPHYLCFLVFPLGAALSLVASWSDGCANLHRIVRFRFVAELVVLLGILPMVHVSISRDNPYGELGGGRYAGMSELIDEAISNAKPQAEDRIAIWGWVPEVYVLSQLTPATPFVSGQATASDGCLVQGWYRARFLECIVQERPRFFLDAVAPGAQGYGYLISIPHESDQALAAWIRSHYRIIAEIHGTPDSQPVRLFEFLH